MHQERETYTKHVYARVQLVSKSNESWFPPTEGWVKVNFDAKVAEGFSRGLGEVICRHEGNILLAGVRRMHAVWITSYVNLLRRC